MTFFGARRTETGAPKGRVVARYSTYEAAQQAVTTLTEKGVPISGIAIVGRELQLVERISGTLSWGQVALSGMGRGLMFGLFIGLFYIIIVQADLQSILLFPLLGMAFGIVFGIVTHAMTRRKRPYASTQQVNADHFDLIVPEEIAGRVQHIIGVQPPVAVPDAPVAPVEVSPAPAPTASTPSSPPVSAPPVPAASPPAHSGPPSAPPPPPPAPPSHAPGGVAGPEDRPPSS